MATVPARGRCPQVRHARRSGRTRRSGLRHLGEAAGKGAATIMHGTPAEARGRSVCGMAWRYAHGGCAGPLPQCTKATVEANLSIKGDAMN
jgi:hypothetical protein